MFSLLLGFYSYVINATTETLLHYDFFNYILYSSINTCLLVVVPNNFIIFLWSAVILFYCVGPRDQSCFFVFFTNRVLCVSFMENVLNSQCYYPLNLSPIHTPLVPLRVSLTCFFTQLFYHL